MEMHNNLKDLTVEAVVRTKPPTIQHMTMDLDAKISMLIEAYSQITGDALTPNLLMNLTEDVADMMVGETLEDIAIMFRMARRGELNRDSFTKKKSFYMTITHDIIPAYKDYKSGIREKVHNDLKAEKTISIIDTIEQGVKDPAFKDKDEFRENIRKLRLSLTPPNRSNLKPVIISGEMDSKSPVDNQDALIESIKESCQNWGDDALKDKIDEWSTLRSHGKYVYILEDELNSRNI